MEPELRDVPVGDLVVRVHSSAGRDGRRPWVLVHGIGMSHRYFRRLHRTLAARGETVHAVDLPGFGGLPRPRRDLGIPAMSDALAEALRTLGVPRALVVGQSMGTQWVTALAARHPQLVAGAALIGPVADERHRTARAQAAALFVDTLRETPGANLLVLTDYARCGTGWYAAQLRHMLAYDAAGAIAEVAAPILVVRGGRDPIAGARWARRMRDAAASARLVEVPGHAHNVQHSAPRTLAAALSAWAATIAPDAGERG
ncbi:alpha/beta fold hydrolase [Microbacterium sp. 10M-3C3]|jgi:pimeloyl-ACP methyl ester carboxylesterase|uniref:alpha/beta fold hydrolase n=1 Tax=Microbacterium sp. 10M-3C3 TaxID=2483401 RepID=UPI000F63BD25|nr:alpha/beta fold hydrolase [Microbacterium sp. 10M-3C3]